VVAKKGRVKLVKPDWCKTCGICIEVCPVEVLELGQDRIKIVYPENCVGCENCELSCPDFVLKVVDENEE